MESILKFAFMFGIYTVMSLIFATFLIIIFDFIFKLINIIKKNNNIKSTSKNTFTLQSNLKKNLK